MIISTTDDLLLVMDDFNARVGCEGDSYTSRLGVRGMFGVGWLNENGDHVLCMIKLSIMDTMFAKKRIHKCTWQHPGTKIWHCIEYVLLRHSQWHYCTDAMVFCSAECWADHVIYITWAREICLICAHEPEDAARADISGKSRPHMLHYGM